MDNRYETEEDHRQIIPVFMRQRGTETWYRYWVDSQITAAAPFPGKDLQYRINEKVYDDLTPEFFEEFQQAVMWDKLRDV